MFWKHTTHVAVITTDCYNKLPIDKRVDFEETHEEPTHRVTESNTNEEESTSNFGLSMLMGEATGSGVLGGVIGGDMLGGMIGSSFNL